MENNILDKLTGTLAADEAGRPLVLSHGTFADFTTFKFSYDIGFHFGSHAQAVRRERDKVAEEAGRRRRMISRGETMPERGEWRIKKVALAVKKVLVHPDDPKVWRSWAAVKEISRHLDPNFVERLQRDGVSDPRLASHALRDLLLREGYDAIVYRNLYESNANGDVRWSWLVLDPGLIVNLPSTIAEDVLEQPIGGRPGISLPGNISDIDGVRGKNGDLKLLKDRRALLDAATAVIEAAGGEVSEEKYVSRGRSLMGQHAFDLGDLTGVIMLDTGRVRIDISRYRGFLGDVWTDMGRVDRHDVWASYEWMPGETATGFVERAAIEIERLREVISLIDVGIVQDEDLDNEAEAEASPTFG
jgi:hypothetical protein